MSIYGEPKNGDFARYVEELSRRGIPSQGLQALPPALEEPLPGATRGRRQKKARPPVATPAEPASIDLSDDDGSAAPPATLASQASQRQAASGLSFFAFIAVCFAVWNLAAFVAEEHSSPTRFVVPGLIAFWLFRAAARARKASRQSAAALPPLNLPRKP